jgi:DNA repair photolyase
MKNKIQFVQYKRILEKADQTTPFQCTYSASPYVGCEYNCVYCRKSYAKQQLMKDTHDPSEMVQIKESAPDILRRELKLAKKGVVCVTGYQSAEKEHRLIRKTLEVLNARQFPLHIITMSDIVCDDLEQILSIAEKKWCAVSFRISTLDKKISEIFEPKAPLPMKRMEAMERFTKRGITSGIALSPVIPYITDTPDNLEEVISTAADKQVNYILAEPLKLTDECRGKVIEVIKRHYPELLLKYKSLYEFGSSPDIRYSNKLRNRTNALLKKYEIPNIMPPYNVGRMKKQARIKDFFK